MQMQSSQITNVVWETDMVVNKSETVTSLHKGINNEESVNISALIKERNGGKSNITTKSEAGSPAWGPKKKQTYLKLNICMVELQPYICRVELQPYMVLFL